MAKEKEHDKRMLLNPEEEIPVHKKKSLAASRSSTEKRSDHKHDYERVIIQSSFTGKETYYWGKRCKICGRVDDGNEFKESAVKGLVKKTEKVKLSDHSYVFKVFYPASELKTLFPGVPILSRDRETNEYVEIV